MSDEAERWRMIRHYLACRADHRCELCGAMLGPGREGTGHHRLPHQRGGTTNPDIDLLCNLLLLCGGALGGVRGCHGSTESYRRDAYALGRLVHQGTDPAVVPVVLYSGRRVLLDPYQPSYLPPADGVSYPKPEVVPPRPARSNPCPGAVGRGARVWGRSAPAPRGGRHG